ncbi:hypothetical protein [Spirosoma linguale]|uniref:Uncharacterized protein n=1 Tax=Spirosoma linguale (strain ATCC 33905 / DSM 74 / LMG 10896 / Claus 1) TaxID=504472 RepID=D2QDF5_SPILD|nr:hypothetical protein Slin_0321 [Spirosoma linguale DSM 74]
MEFTVTVDPEVIDVLGADQVSAFLNDAATKLKLKVAAKEALADINYFDELVNDPTWEKARQQAWEQEQHH